MMWAGLGMLVMVALRLLRRGARRSKTPGGAAAAATVLPGSIDTGGLGWARDPITGCRDRGGF